MEINHRTEKHRTTVERENSPEGSLRRCWLSEVVRRKKMVAVGFHVEVNRVILSPFQTPSTEIKHDRILMHRFRVNNYQDGEADKSKFVYVSVSDEGVDLILLAFYLFSFCKKNPFLILVTFCLQVSCQKESKSISLDLFWSPCSPNT
ncbi:hypothetical protein LXL04_035261 [Taraxacum kok-saghyz]